MARPVDVERDYIMGGTVRLVHDVGHSRRGLRVCSEQTNERLTIVPIFELRKPTIPMPDHMEWMEHFCGPIRAANTRIIGRISVSLLPHGQHVYN